MVEPGAPPAPTAGTRWTSWPLRALLGGLVVAVAAGLVAHGGGVPGWEQAAFHGINGLPDVLRGPMWVLQLAGLLLVPVLVAPADAARFRR